MNTMLAVLGLGGGELILILVTLLLTVGLPIILAVGLIVYFVGKRGKTKPQPDMFSSVFEGAFAPATPGAPPQPPPCAAKTEVMPCKCPQCGALLQPDVPEGLCPACLLQRGFATEGGAPPGAPSFVPPPLAELAALFPQLEILECLGRGGMGAVYKARQPRLDRFVALKILAPEKQNELQFAERFEREARALARLNHPNIVTVFDFGEVQGRFYLLMEYVDGLTLRQLLQTGKIAPAEALDIVPKICAALQYAHEHGIVHRDIKPENILLDKQGRVKIADFGIAKIAGLEPKDFSLTGAQDVMGTPHYMAPEQIEKPQTVDHRADIYSLGVVFYEMLTGELPLGKFAPPSQKVQMDVRLDEVVLHALEKEPARRYQHASQVKTDVETVASSLTPGIKPTTPPPLSAAVASNASDKTILPAFLLAFFFGIFGAHRFYVGKNGTAVLQLCTCGGFGIWATIDWILIVCKAFTDCQGRRITNWINPDASEAKPPVKASGGGNPNPLTANVPAPGDRSGLIVAPAVALMIAGGWKILSAFLNALFLLPGGNQRMNKFFASQDFFGGWGSTIIFSIVLFKLLPGLLILFGGYQMLQRRSYAWAVAAGIISIVSCSLISFPIGIWALIVLARDDVKSAFGANISASPGSETVPPKPDQFWRRFAVVMACVILLPVAIAILGLLAAIAIPNFVKGRNRAMEINAQSFKQAGINQESNGGEFRKNSTQSFPLNTDGRFSLDHIKGRIEIHGWSSNAVIINAAIHGKTGESVAAVKINIDSDLDHASVHTEQPSSVTGFPWSWLWFKNDKRNDASVDYTIQVPDHARMADISSVNGSIVISGVAGDIVANTVNGELRIKDAAHNLKLETVNGSIKADMSLLGNGQTVSLDAVNGEIALAVPDEADAKFSASTINGGVTSEFPALKVKKEIPGSKNLKGSLGHGGANVKISTVNGGVKILKRQAPNAKAAERPGSTQLFYEWRGTNWVAETSQGSRPDSPAVAAAKRWLTLVDAGNCADSWKETATFVQGKKTEAGWTNYLNTNRTALGTLISRQLVASIPLIISNGVPTSPAVSEPITASPPGAPDGPYVFMLFQSSFAEKKDAKECVTFSLENDGQWRAASYFIK